MADPRRISTRRAVLSYEHLKQLTKDWPDLLIKDYQGIFQDSSFLADEIDALELRVIQNEEDINILQEKVIELEERIEALEYRMYKIVQTENPLTTGPFETIICKNTGAIDITLDPSAKEDDEVNIKRRGDIVNVIGKIDGLTNMALNVERYSMKLVFDGTEWSEI